MMQTTTQQLRLSYFKDVSGNFLANGHDGAFTVNKTTDADGSKRLAAINAAYIKAFTGELDARILSATRIPAVALFDANFPMAVKTALVKLALFRFNELVYLDINELSTPAALM